MKGWSGMRNISMRVGTGLIALVLVGALQVPSVAIGRGVGRSTSAPSARTSVQRVKIVDFAFKPGTITIAKGTRVRWTNAGNATHTSTSKTGVWDSGSLAPGATFSRVFRKAGTFKYHCTIHPTLMHGKIVVT
jgi:plastocyanin